MPAFVADTHTAVWYLLNSKKLSSNAQRDIPSRIHAHGMALPPSQIPAGC
jgi:PIN domain nuclease of toxin-antitoxin system